MRCVVVSLLAITLCGNATAAELTEGHYDRIRTVLSGAVGERICSGKPLAGFCAALGTEAVYWLDKGVSIAIDRYFEMRDQAFADKNNMTICYSDGKCLKPR